MWVSKILLLEKTEGIRAATERMTAKTERITAETERTTAKTEGKATTEDLP
jgi:hypothetical protein